MSRREIFASNLRRLCDAHGSIAKACRGMQINRQQFSRYLAATSLPDDTNMRKICTYFGIAEGDLFLQSGLGFAQNDTTGRLTSIREPHTRAAIEMLASEQHASLPPGRYFMTFCSPSDPGTVVRATLIVSREANVTTFRRITGYAEQPNSFWAHYNGDHRGIILERRSCLYLVAMNELGNREPSLITLKWLPSERTLLAGHASLFSEAGPSITAVVVTECGPNVSLRQALERSHVYSVDDPNIDATVIDTLEKQSEELKQMVRSLDLSVTDLSETSKKGRRKIR